jgi:hypothetical protein
VAPVAATHDAEAAADRTTVHLIRLGLLPNPDGEQLVAEGIRFRRPAVLAEYLEQVVHQMAERIESNQEFADRQARQLDEINNHANRLTKALNWLREEYDLDELALQVIEHVTNQGNRVGYIW